MASRFTHSVLATSRTSRTSRTSGTTAASFTVSTHVFLTVALAAGSTARIASAAVPSRLARGAALSLTGGVTLRETIPGIIMKSCWVRTMGSDRGTSEG